MTLRAARRAGKDAAGGFGGRERGASVFGRESNRIESSEWKPPSFLSARRNAASADASERAARRARDVSARRKTRDARLICRDEHDGVAEVNRGDVERERTRTGKLGGRLAGQAHRRRRPAEKRFDVRNGGEDVVSDAFECARREVTRRSLWKGSNRMRAPAATWDGRTTAPWRGAFRPSPRCG